MTHDELLATIEKSELGWYYDWMKEALRAVVELHNCMNKYCGNCGMASPCFTIEAIMKELQ
jgi:hypothetical protein